MAKKAFSKTLLYTFALIIASNQFDIFAMNDQSKKGLQIKGNGKKLKRIIYHHEGRDIIFGNGPGEEKFPDEKAERYDKGMRRKPCADAGSNSSSDIGRNFPNSPNPYFWFVPNSQNTNTAIGSGNMVPTYYFVPQYIPINIDQQNQGMESFNPLPVHQMVPNIGQSNQGMRSFGNASVPYMGSNISRSNQEIRNFNPLPVLQIAPNIDQPNQKTESQDEDPWDISHLLNRKPRSQDMNPCDLSNLLNH